MEDSSNFCIYYTNNNNYIIIYYGFKFLRQYGCTIERCEKVNSINSLKLI